jgi:SAM-dependent MidA family methyltransferase
VSLIRETLQAALHEHHGSLPFDRFMEIALHHPEGGYYATRIRGIGRGGDFTTVPTRSRSLGRAVARWLRARGAPELPVIECGPGDASLASAVLQEFGWFERRRVRLHLVETSAPLREQQKQALRARRVHWHQDIRAALEACGGRALIYHNEFFDAFPCRVFRRTEDAWAELHLEVADSRLTAAFRAPGRPLPASTALPRDWPAGQRVEVFAAVADWMCGMAPSWTGGAMLAIDYGTPVESLYHRRPQGTLRAYRRHERLEGGAVFEMPGLQDVTADVNFSDLAEWAQMAGWTVGPVRPLAAFLGSDAGDLPRAAAEAFRCAEFVRD